MIQMGPNVWTDTLDAIGIQQYNPSLCFQVILAMSQNNDLGRNQHVGGISTMSIGKL